MLLNLNAHKHSNPVSAVFIEGRGGALGWRKKIEYNGSQESADTHAAEDDAHGGCRVHYLHLWKLREPASAELPFYITSSLYILS